MPGAVHAAFVRSSHAHAMISIDTAAAKAMPGVLLVLTGEDWAAARLGVLPCVWQIRSSDGSPMREALCEVLARDRVLHVGDTIAVRSEEHTSEIQSLMRISYAVFCLTQTNPSKQHNKE